jgi:hypothetical protein
MLVQKWKIEQTKMLTYTHLLVHLPVLSFLALKIQIRMQC